MGLNTMKVALIGPTALDLMSSVSGISKDTYVQAARKVGELVAKHGHELIVVPDRGIAVEGMNSYLENGGKTLTGICPGGEITEYQKTTLKVDDHRSCCHNVVSNLTWCDQHSVICEMADIMICCGISCGTLCEIAWTKWMQKPKTYVLRDTVSALPPEMMAEALVEYVNNFSQVEELLK